MTDRGTFARGVVVGVDGSASSLRALRWALATAGPSDSRVMAVHAWDFPLAVRLPSPFGQPVPPIEIMEAGALAELEAAIGSIGGQDTDRVEPRVGKGTAANILLEAAGDADMLVVGTRGRGTVTGVMLGSVSRRVAGHASCPVAVIPSDWDESDVARTGVGIDGSDNSVAALRWALDHTDGEIVAINTWEEPVTWPEGDQSHRIDWEGRAEQIVSHALATAEVTTEERSRIQTIVRNGDPRVWLLDEALELQMIVIGARGESGLVAIVLGSITAYVAGHSKVPVVIVPASDESEITV